jgi:hypothetical protein
MKPIEPEKQGKRPNLRKNPVKTGKNSLTGIRG